MKKALKILDILLVVVIFLSIMQLILDDIGIVYYADNKAYQDLMVYSAFLFDFIFSVEFIARSVIALRKKNFRQYFLFHGGWIDLLASLPLLFLNSGPLLILTLAGQSETATRSILNLMKIVKAIRVARILRILRLLKIFGRIENVFSNMVQHHITAISSIMVIASILMFLFLHITGFIRFDDAVLEAKFSLVLSTMLIAAVVMVSILYSAYFAKTVSDPIYVMKRGFKEEDYKLSVKIPVDYQTDEVFELARSYNSLWLPLKAKLIAAYKKKLKPGEAAEGEDYTDLF